MIGSVHNGTCMSIFNILKALNLSDGLTVVKGVMADIWIYGRYMAERMLLRPMLSLTCSMTACNKKGCAMVPDSSRH